jgi:DNA-binding NarL/FixJ family response regulator
VTDAKEQKAAGRMVKVLIVDDQVLIRAGIAAILRAVPGYEVVGEACDGAEAVALAERHEPDVVLMDIRMPDTDGITATRRIRASGRENVPRILILTTHDLDEYVYHALHAGADGFVLKDTPPERLLAALKAVADGDTLFSPTVTRRLVQAYVTVAGADDAPPTAASRVPRSRLPEGGSASSADRTALATLTARETDVLRLVATGLSNGEIAERLVVSEATVKTHLNRAMAKLNLSSRAQVVVLAYESGLVLAGQPQE